MPLARLLVAALVLASSHARAAGQGVPDLGGAGLAQAGAFIAAPDDATALYYNPAGLAAIDGWRLQLDGRASRVDVTFQRLAPDGTSQGYDPVENTGGFAPAPMPVVARRLEVGWARRLVVAFGGHPMNGYSGYRFNDPTSIRAENPGISEQQVTNATAQRYSLISAASIVYLPAIAAGAELTDRLRVGATLQFPVAFIRQRQAISATGQDSAEFDGVMDVDVSDALNVSGVLGASVKLAEGLHLGASFQAPLDFVAEGTITAELAPALEGNARLEPNPTRATLEITFPWIARVGLRLVRPAFQLELAATWEAWHLQRRIRLLPRDAAVVIGDDRVALPPITLEKGLVDAGSLRLGGELSLGAFVPALEGLRVRAGLVVESSALPLEKTSVDSPHWERLGAAFGAAFRFGDFDAAAGFVRLFQPDRSVRASRVLQLVALPPSTNVVGNGDYSASIVALSAMLSARFE